MIEWLSDKWDDWKAAFRKHWRTGDAVTAILIAAGFIHSILLRHEGWMWLGFIAGVSFCGGLNWRSNKLGDKWDDEMEKRYCDLLRHMSHIMYILKRDSIERPFRVYDQEKQWIEFTRSRIAELRKSLNELYGPELEPTSVFNTGADGAVNANGAS